MNDQESQRKARPTGSRHTIACSMFRNGWLLALVVRKGSNFDPVLCGLSPPVSGGRLKAHMYTF